MARAYLDHASCVPLRVEGRHALLDALDRFGADPGRLHAEGMAARAALEHARDQLAGLLGARGREVVFTSGASEAIAAVCWGAAQAGDGPQVLSRVEHSAVRLGAAKHGAVIEIGVDHHARIDVEQIDRALDAKPSIVHVQWANHEVGTRQPVAEIVERCRERNVLVHVDAAQGVGRDPIAFDDLGADLLSLSGPKFGAPMGTGALLIRRGVRLDPLLVGGDQERARRAGLENVPGFVALGAVAELLTDPAVRAREAETDRARIERLAAALTGDDGVTGITRLGDPTDRVPHLLCCAIEGVEPQPVLLGLDQRGVAAHSGSSCSTESLEPSPVLEAMGVDAQRSLRLSVGWSTVDDDIDRAVTALAKVIGDLRRLRG